VAVGKGLRKLIEDLEILKDEHSDYKIKDLNVTGEDIIKELGISPGPKVGDILEKLLEEVIENPTLNKKNTLLSMIKEWL
jgi:tRNA nucleotidyltransferase/poly(A) polymerase